MQIHELPEGTLNENDVMAVDDGQTTRKVSLNGVVPYPSTSSPLMDGTASAGESAYFSRGDHVHPTDTSRVNKAGDTMTGILQVRNANLALQDTNIDRTRDPSAATNSKTIEIRDTNGSSAAFMQARETAAGYHMVSLGANGGSGTNYQNRLDVGVDNDGNYYTAVTNPESWRTALQLNVRDVVVESKTATISSVAANSASTGTSLNVAKSGYTFLGVVGFSASTSAVVFGRCSRASDTTVGYFVRNVTSSAVSNVTLTFNCLYYR